MQYRGNIIDIQKRRIFKGIVHVREGHIDRIEEVSVEENSYLLPGFVDAHVHIESSMLTPMEFGRIALKHGTVATVSDPHEIANVVGISGVEFMIQNAEKTPLKIHFGAPSCVPASPFETAGAAFGFKEVQDLLHREEIYYLSEVMNFPAVIASDPFFMRIIAEAQLLDKPVDGHAPGLYGQDINRYFGQGITTDHECVTLEEARAKANEGVKILIREGSAAKNFEALIPLMFECPKQLMFCSDDKHPDDLMVGHINLLVLRALTLGCDLYDVLYSACIHPVEHYKLPVGLLREGDPADFIRIENLENFKILDTIINGESAMNTTSAEQSNHLKINQFSTGLKTADDFEIITAGRQVRLIEAIDKELITRSTTIDIPRDEDLLNGDISLITVVNRYIDQKPITAFIKGFGIKKGAIASSVAHDSHNIVCVGSSADYLTSAVNLVIAEKGGISLVGDGISEVLGLPIAGIMSNQPAEEVSMAYSQLDRLAKVLLGSALTAPFMTLSFMALLVIPSLKIGDQGLFDVNTFQLVDLDVD